MHSLGGGAIGVHNEVIVDGYTHLHTSVISQVQHLSAISFSPVLPSVSFGHPLVYLTVKVNIAPCRGSNTVGVEGGIIWGIVPRVFPANVLVKPVYLLLLVIITRIRDWPVIREPRNLRRVHKCCNSNGVLDLTNLSPQDHIGKLLKPIEDVVPGVVPHQVIVASNNTDIHGSVMPPVQVLDPVSISECVDTSTWYSDIITVESVTSILHRVTTHGSKVHMEGAV